MVILFYIASVIAVVSTLMVITRLSAIHALLYMIVSLLSVAVIFFVIGAPFIATLEVIIYAGAIMVLFVFAVMMLNLGSKSVEQEQQLLSGKMWIGPSVLSLILFIEFIYVLLNSQTMIYNPETIPPKEVGISMFTTYLLGVELAGMLLMAGIVGAYHIGREKRKVYHRFFDEGINK